MKGSPTRRTHLKQLAAGTILLTPLQAALGQPKATRLIYPFSPGSSAATATRAIAEQMGKTLGEAIYFDAKPGGGGIVGLDAGIKSAADGYTITTVAQHVNTLPLLHRKLPADFKQDFEFISQLFRYYNAIVVPPGSAFKNIQDLITAARSNPGKISFGSVQVGGFSWSLMKLLAMAAGARFNEIVYQTTSQLLVDMLGGRVDVGGALIGDARQHLESGKLRALGVSSPREAPQLPGIPPVAATVPGFELSAWFGLAVPKGTPTSRVNALEKAATAAVRHPEMQARFIDWGLEGVGSDREEFAKFLREEAALYGRIYSSAGVQPE